MPIFRTLKCNDFSLALAILQYGIGRWGFKWTRSVGRIGPTQPAGGAEAQAPRWSLADRSENNHAMKIDQPRCCKVSMPASTKSQNAFSPNHHPHHGNRSPMNLRKLLLIAALVLLVGAFFAFDLGRYLSLDFFKSQQAAIEAYRAAQTGSDRRVLLRDLRGGDRPVAAGRGDHDLGRGRHLRLMVGHAHRLFRLHHRRHPGLPRLAFRAARLGAGQVRRAAETINAGVEKEGGFYLFTLRLVPIFPFFVINLVMGLTPIRTGTFYWVGQVGMLAGTLVYVNAGTQLAQIDSLQGILSPGLLASFVLLGCFR